MTKEMLLKLLKGIISIAPAIISAYTSVYVSSKKPNKHIARERLDTVIFPVFEYFERFPNFENTKQFYTAVEKAEAIIRQNHMLTGVELYTIFYDFYTNRSKDLYRKFYLSLIRETSELFWQCGLPIISMNYRKTHNMLSKREKYLVRFTPFIYTPSLITLVGFFFSMLILMTWK